MTRPQPPPISDPLPPDELARMLRAVLRELSRTLQRVDAEALSDWILAGLSIFPRNHLPSLRTTTAAARTTVLALAAERHHGNITRIARVLGTSRRSIREQLRRTGLYDELVDASTSSDPGEPDEQAPDDDEDTPRIDLEDDDGEG